MSLHKWALASKSLPNHMAFGQVQVSRSQCFLASSLSFAVVNLKPVVPGHVLFCPKRACKRVQDLTSEEVSDLFNMVHQAFPILEREFGAGSMTLAVQDGPDAGQTIHHVHVHVMPRRKGDFEGDQIYRAIEEDRKARTSAVMAAEADRLRSVFEQTSDKL